MSVVEKPPQRHRVLVVDDDASLRELLCRSLGRQGFETIEASDGQEAFERFNEAQSAAEGRALDAMVTDFLMPRMDGAQLVRKIKEISPDFPVVLVTGEAPDPIVIGLAQLSRCLTLIKPFRPQALREALARVLDYPLPNGQKDLRKSMRTESAISCIAQCDQEEVRATIRNLSFGGCMVECGKAFDVGSKLRLMLQGLEKYSILSKVIWARADLQRNLFQLGILMEPETEEVDQFMKKFVLHKLKQKGIGIMGAGNGASG